MREGRCSTARYVRARGAHSGGKTTTAGTMERRASSEESERVTQSNSHSANLRDKVDASLQRRSGVRSGSPVRSAGPDQEDQILDMPLRRHASASGSASSALRERQQLHRFSLEAASFLERKSRRGSTSSNDAVLLDKERLQRFHAHAVSFLDRAYADEPETIVDETPLSPGAVSRAAAIADDARSVARDRKMLEVFHQEAMSFLEAAAKDDAAFLVDDDLDDDEDSNGKRLSGVVSPKRRSKGRYTAMRIKKDKQRLEQHYRDAMSFLEKAEAGDRRVLVEEQELDSPALERFQLREYAREAMSFLDNAFRSDAAVLIDDDEELSAGGHELARRRSPDTSPHWHAATEEDQSIAHDRAALERFDEEVGDYLSRVYNDDSTLIVEDAESETSRSDRGLYARPMMPLSSNSRDSASYGSNDHVDDLSDEVHTDDEFQDPTLADAVLPSPGCAAQSSFDDEGAGDQLESPTPRDLYNDSRYFVRVQSERFPDQHTLIRRQMERYELEAGDFIDGANVSDDEEAYSDGEHVEHSRAVERNTNSMQHSAGVREDSVKVAEDDFGADQQIDDGIEVPCASAQAESPRGRSSPLREDIEQEEKSSPGERSCTPLGPAPAQRRPSESKASGPGVNKDVVVDLILEDNLGKSQEWSEVPLQRSFYRQLPRGSTIKIRARNSKGVSKDSSSSKTKPSTPFEYQPTLQKELTRIASERDAVIAALEEIVNERSKLAAQVGEMKEMIAGAVGHKGDAPALGSRSGSLESEFDLSAELRNAYETMRNMTEETEETLNYVESRREGAEHGKNVAERRVRECEREIAELKQQLAKHAEMAANDVDGARFSRVSSMGSSVTRTTECDGSCTAASRAIDDLHATRAALANAERSASQAEQRLNEVKDEAHAQYRAVADRENQLAMRTRQLENRLNDMEHVIEEERRRALEAQMSRDSAEHKARQLQKALEASENNLLNERCDLDTKIVAAVEKVRAEKDEDVKSLVLQLEKMGSETREISSLRSEIDSTNESLRSMRINLVDAEATSDNLRKELAQLSEEHRETLRQLKETRDQYEESLRVRVANVDQSKEMVELQNSLRGLRGEAQAREEKLRVQLELFKRRTEQAESAATVAEQNAQQAVEAASAAQNNVRTQVEAERKARKVAEEQRNLIEQELRSREREAVSRNERHGGVSNVVDVIKSSSQRGLKKSSSKAIGRDSRKKKDGHRGGSALSDESGSSTKKKGGHRLRIFG